MTVAKALRRLVARGKVRVISQGTSRFVFLAGHRDMRPPLSPDMRRLVAAAAGRVQKEILDTMEKEGWARSTTQHRLGRLVEHGWLKTTQHFGRWLEYSKP